MTEEVDCFRYDGHVLCEACGKSERCEIVESSGKPWAVWEGTPYEDCWPQRGVCLEGSECANCRQPV